jgi:hypothetical protein
MPNQIQSSNITKFFVLNFDIHLTFACLPVGREFEIWIYGTSSRLSATVRLMSGRRKRQNGNIARPFNGDGHLSLVFCTVPGDPTRDDLSSFRNKISKDPRVLIVDI